MIRQGIIGPIQRSAMTISLEKGTPLIHQQHDATWQNYIALRDSQATDWRKIVFYQGWLWADMGREGPNHASFSDLVTAIFFIWAFLHPDEMVSVLWAMLD